MPKSSHGTLYHDSIAAYVQWKTAPVCTIMRVDLSPRWGDTQWPINPPLLSSSHSPSFPPGTV